MNSKLNHIQNWLELAQKANWSASEIARQCGVTVRTLHRYILKKMGKNTKAWLAEQRHRNAQELLRKGSSIKEVASRLGYKQQTNFARQYKYKTGTCPSLESAQPNQIQGKRL